MSTPAELASQRLFAPHIVTNTHTISTIKFISSSLAGAVAGILGLENAYGFTLFAFSTLFSSLCMLVLNLGGKPRKYLPGGWVEMVNPGQENVMSFVLVWTLFYGVFSSHTRFCGLVMSRLIGAAVCALRYAGIVHGTFFVLVYGHGRVALDAESSLFPS